MSHLSDNKTVKALNRRRLAFNRFVMHCQPAVRRIAVVLSLASFIAALAAIVSIVILLGFDHSPGNQKMLGRVISACGATFAINVVFGLIFNWDTARRTSRPIKWVLDIVVLITVLPLIYPHPENPWFPWLEKILYNRTIIFSIIGAYAIWEMCYGITRMFGRRANPSLLLASSFLFFILIGSFLLMMPKCTTGEIGYVDSLFVSTSAVCITGLSTVDVAQSFTPLGLLILSLMIQIGGLGVMTFTSFFALFFSGNTSIFSQLMVKDMIQSKTINALLPTLLYILGFTLVIELAGAIMIFFSIHGTLDMTLEDELIFSGFHSLSAFCNAGFSNLDGGMANPQLLYHNQSIYLIASLLIFLGGIGFPILVNFKTALSIYLHRFWNRISRNGRSSIRVKHVYDINTKLVMTITLVIFLLSTVMFFVLEYNNSLAGMSLSDKIVQSVFNAWSPRSSGFSSVNPAGFMTTTIIMVIILMWIGGASQSTAGGIKVNTFGVILLELKSVITGKSRVVAYNRTIAHDSIRRAFAVVTLSLIGYAVYSFILIALEPGMSPKALLFESASALFTVGSSFGITAELCDASKILLATAMFVGRVGMLSLLIGLIGQKSEPPIKYPTDNIIIS